jgi:hypothetical protein
VVCVRATTEWLSALVPPPDTPAALLATGPLLATTAAVSAVMVMMIPLQANVTVPPPCSAQASVPTVPGVP